MVESGPSWRHRAQILWHFPKRTKSRREEEREPHASGVVQCNIEPQEGNQENKSEVTVKLIRHQSGSG